MRILGPAATGPTQDTIPADRLVLVEATLPHGGGLVAITALLDTLGTAGGTSAVRAVAYQGSTLIGAGPELELPAGQDPEWITLAILDDWPEGLQMLAGAVRLGLHVGPVGDSLRVWGWEDGGGLRATDTYADGAAATLPATSADLKPSLYGVYYTVEPDPNLDDAYFARRGFYSAQAKLGETGPEKGSGLRAACGWHGTWLDAEPQGGSFAIVQDDGALAHLLGERVKITSGDRSAIAYVHNALDLDTGDDISLSRRAFVALAPLATEELHVTVETLT